MDTIKLGLNVSNFVDSYRNIGYTIETAVADIIDNSIFAQATRIDINMIWEDFKNDYPELQIVDNGLGMSNEELIESMRLACKSPSDYRDPSDLGRFGLGLKSASFSQCNLLTVGSKKENCPKCCKQWDVGFIRNQNEFLLIDYSLEESGIENLIPDEHGTFVRWTQMDQLNIPEDADESKKEQFWNQIMSSVRNHISMTFGSFKEKIKFYFNGNEIPLWDPFLVSHMETNLLADESVWLDGHEVKVRSYILPSKLSIQDEIELTRQKSMNDLQGFYVYRNNRLIIAGSWLGLKDLQKKEAYRLAHIRLDIDNTMDSLWHIDIKKELATCPPELQEKLISYAKQARTTSSKAFRTRKKTIRNKHKIDEKTAYIWSYGTKEGRAFFQVNRENPTIRTFKSGLNQVQRDEFDRLLKYIENYIPVMSILETESNSHGDYVSNNASDVEELDILESFKSTLEEYVETIGNYDDAVRICAFSEPYASNYDVIYKYLKEQGVEL